MKRLAINVGIALIGTAAIILSPVLIGGFALFTLFGSDFR